MDKNVSFFLGANLKDGFVSYFDTFHNLDEGFFTYIIKGGPGTGKSGIMKKVAEHFENLGFKTILAPCSSDPDSLDGVMIPALKVSILDGTAPHIVDAVYPACRDTIINVGAFWDEEKINKFDREVVSVTNQNKKLLRKAARYISAASEMSNDTFKSSFAAVDTAKLSRFTTRFIARKLPEINNLRGKEYSALLSAITPKGVINFNDSIDSLCDFVLSFEDNYGSASRMFLESVRASAIMNGYDVISLYCPLHPKTKLEHLIIPQAKIGIFTSMNHNPADFKNMQRVHSERFYNKKMLSDKKERINFNIKASAELINEAVQVLKEAKSVHDIMEEYYIDGMDFEKVDTLTKRIIREIELRM
jgi:hypothetical protein